MFIKEIQDSSILMKKTKKYQEAHSANTKFGMGDYYGTGIRAPLGKMRDGMGMIELNPKQKKQPPKSLA